MRKMACYVIATAALAASFIAFERLSGATECCGNTVSVQTNPKKYRGLDEICPVAKMMYYGNGDWVYYAIHCQTFAPNSLHGHDLELNCSPNAENKNEDCIDPTRLKKEDVDIAKRFRHIFHPSNGSAKAFEKKKKNKDLEIGADCRMLASNVVKLQIHTKKLPGGMAYVRLQAVICEPKGRTSATTPPPLVSAVGFEIVDPMNETIPEVPYSEILATEYSDEEGKRARIAYVHYQGLVYRVILHKDSHLESKK